jgi:hypothetical protein
MAFHVPPYKLGLKSDQKFNNMSQQDSDYYKQCLQIHYESAEVCLDEGLSLPSDYRTEFDIKGLMRMDPISRAEAASKRLGASMTSVNEEREDEDMPPVDGGEKPLAQQQIWPIDVLAKRPPPEASPAPTAAPAPAEEEEAKAVDVALLRLKFGDELRRAA